MALGQGDWLRARHAEGILDHTKDGDGLLTTAVEHDRADMLQLLLDLGFDVHERRRTVGREGIEESRGNPLDRAAERGDIAMVELLLAHGGDPNAGAVTTAYNRHDRAMLDLLEKHDGHVNANITKALQLPANIRRSRVGMGRWYPWLSGHITSAVFAFTAMTADSTMIGPPHRTRSGLI